MSLFDTIKSFLGSKGVELPANLDTPEELTNKAKELASRHADKLDTITNSIPGEADDAIADQIKRKME